MEYRHPDHWSYQRTTGQVWLLGLRKLWYHQRKAASTANRVAEALVVEKVLADTLVFISFPDRTTTLSVIRRRIQICTLFSSFYFVTRMRGGEPRNIQDDCFPYRPLPTSSCNIVCTEDAINTRSRMSCPIYSHLQTLLKPNCCLFITRASISCSSLLVKHPAQLKGKSRKAII